ncbi:DUF6443 domain-containing protein, partial [Wenyingzhuangia sp. chi5]
MKKFNKFILKVVAVFTLLFTTTSLQAQSLYGHIYGPTTADLYTTETYGFTDYYSSSYFDWYIYGGAVQGNSYNSAEVDVLWNEIGSNLVTVDYDDAYGNILFDELEVNVTGSAPDTPPVPTIQQSSCGSIVLERATPPSGVTYYWQNNLGGKSTANSASTMTMTNSGTLFLRARDSNGTWSIEPSSITYTVNQLITWYRDQDGDGLGDPNDSSDPSCTQPEGYVSNDDDLCPTQYGSSSGGCAEDTDLSNQNYVYTITPQVPTYEFNFSSLKNDQKIETVNYYDGLGRPMQNIAIHAGGKGEDIITHIAYDEFGRQNKDYLPYTTTNNLGGFISTAESDVLTYYDQSKYDVDFPSMGISTINPFSEKELEASPLNRVLKQAAPGKDWKLGNGHEIEIEYDANEANEVKLFEVSISESTINSVKVYSPTLTQDGFYAAGELYKTITYDENHNSGTEHSTEEFKDKQGRVILKRTYAEISGTSTAHDTYYVYDDYGNLSFVLPPKMDVATNSLTTIINNLDTLGYQYEYDHRNRLVEKRIPGKEVEYIVYDKLDRPVLTQDANLRNENKWLFTKYDVFGRVAFTGFHNSNSSTTRTVMQSNADNNTNYTQYVTKNTTSSNLGGTYIYYSNGPIPHGVHGIYTINYYDTYIDLPSSLSSVVTNIFEKTSTTKTKGLPTVNKVKVLGTNNWITTVTYYDDKTNPIYVYSNNSYLGTTDIVESEFDFVGKVIRTKTTHKKTGKPDIKTLDFFEYDHMGRLTKQTQAIDGATTPEVIVENTYDELGQLTSKGVGGKNGQARLQNVDYTYNIRGWL